MPGAITSFPPLLSARLNYYKPSNDSFAYLGTAKEKLREFDVTEVTIRDIRCCNEDFNLDKNGFQLVEHESVEKAFENEEDIRSTVYNETAELLKRTTGASRVEVLQHVRRRDTHQKGIELAQSVSENDYVKTQGPSMWVHVDQSYEGAAQLVRDKVDDAESLMKTRWAIINVWRPVKQVTREALAVCDSRSVDENDLHEVTSIIPQSAGVGKGFGVFYGKANPAHKWYYVSNMKPEEVLMIKCFDSKKDGRARRCIHTAFQSEYDYGDARQSIDFRCLVFWEDQECE